MITFTDLASKLPAGAVEFVGNNQVKINASVIAEQALTLDSSIVEVMVKLLQGLTSLTQDINTARAAHNPPLTAITFADSQLVGTPSAPRYQLTLNVAVNPTSFNDNLLDPTGS
ncbi:MAG: hypothetical protein KME46_32390 [Brasilonema angustatum HA4187-MV1]|jgi:hypothetical protein|nr:hypothetical protein [Brasilonema angustatum HA4187-MV1]